jgi:long-chain acyl-CoA synthetase
MMGAQADREQRRRRLLDTAEGLETMIQGRADSRASGSMPIEQIADATFPRLLVRHLQERPGRPAIREKALGIWQTLSWSALHAEVSMIAAGLAAQGFRRGENLAIIGENRPRLYAAMIAAQVLGGVPVPLYQDAVAVEMIYVLRDASIRFAVVEDQEQVDKLLEIRTECPLLERIVYDQPRGLRNYDQPELMSYDRLVEAGRRLLAEQPGFIDAEIARGSPDDVAAIFYTSGTTGNPKGVIHGHRNLITMSAVASRMEGLTDAEEVLAYLPMAWIGQNIFSYSQWLVNGFTVNCPESAATVTADMREIGPSYYFAPPRVLEMLLTQVTIRMEDAGLIKRSLYRHFMGVARRVGEPILNGEPGVGIVDRFLYRLGDLMMYGPLRNALGMSRVKVAYTAGEAIGPDLFVFYRSLGINLKQLYGSTETAVFVCVQPNGQVKADTVGPPVQGVEVKITDSGEILIRSPGLLREYYRNPKATAEVKDPEGWYHTGDAGFFDADGHLKIIDRAKDVGKMADGSMFAPKYIENKLKFFPYIKEAVAFGDGRDRAMAFVNIDFEACSDWAERRNISFAGYADLAGKPEIRTLVQECVEKVNLDLASDPMMSASQIHRFMILHKELDADDEELTRTRKVRRGFIGQKYQELVDALYSGATEQYTETMVRFEDGRVGSVSATLRVVDARTFAGTGALRKAA